MALARGDLDKMSCAEKLDCLSSVQRSKENLPLLDLLLVCINDFDTFHTQCFKTKAKAKTNGLAVSWLGCVLNTNRLADKLDKISNAMIVWAEENKRKEDKRSTNGAQIDEKRPLEKEAIGKRQRRSARKRGNKEKKITEVENAPAGKVAVLSVEKVKVKASLRSKISELEMEEERGKLAVASAIEEENKHSLARESRLTIVFDEKCQLELELGDIEAAMGSLLERKRKVVEKQEEAKKEMEELEERRKDSEKLTAAKIKDWTEKIEDVQEELKVVHQELQLVEGRGETVNSDLEKFMERQINELKEELECPVCLEVATKAPIYKCSDDHIVCRYCFAVLPIKCLDVQ